jgi:hypothetical protein
VHVAIDRADREEPSIDDVDAQQGAIGQDVASPGDRRVGSDAGGCGRGCREGLNCGGGRGARGCRGIAGRIDVAGVGAGSSPQDGTVTVRARSKTQPGRPVRRPPLDIVPFIPV